MLQIFKNLLRHEARGHSLSLGISVHIVVKEAGACVGFFDWYKQVVTRDTGLFGILMRKSGQWRTVIIRKFLRGGALLKNTIHSIRNCGNRSDNDSLKLSC
ncbi:hypothetical protein OAE80_03130 [Planctomycetaceae bacterium]|nr:hypothetical protein [Planctomycetaceae bacterium]